MYLQNLEVSAWRRLGSQTDHKLPAEVVKAEAALGEIQAEIEELGWNPPPIPSTEALVREGVPPREVGARQREADEAASAHAVRLADLEAARNILGGDLDAAIMGRRDELILGLRPFVDALTAKARPIVEAGYHDRESVLATGDGKALKGHQTLRDLERQFGHVMASWRESFASARMEIHDDSFDVRWLSEAFQYWARPDLVKADDLAGRGRTRGGAIKRIEITLTDVVREAPESGFRLATIEELRAKLPEVLAAVKRQHAGHRQSDMMLIGVPGEQA